MKSTRKVAQLLVSAVAIAVLLAASGARVVYDTAEAYSVFHGTTSLNPNGLLVSDTATLVNQNGTPVNNVPTYRAVIADLTPAASATDVTTVCGAAGKLVKVTAVEASATATAASNIDFYVYLRTAADTGGTSAVVTAATLDQNNLPSSATALKWTANPAVVASGVAIAGAHYIAPAAASAVSPTNQFVQQFGSRNTQAVVLRGANQCVAFSLNGNAVPAGASLYVNWEWTEE